MHRHGAAAQFAACVVEASDGDGVLPRAHGAVGRLTANLHSSGEGHGTERVEPGRAQPRVSPAGQLAGTGRRP